MTKEWDSLHVAKYELKRALEELVGQATRRLKEVNDGRSLHVPGTMNPQTYTHDLLQACTKVRDMYQHVVAIEWAMRWERDKK